jgi:thioesterase domain-containing protein
VLSLRASHGFGEPDALWRGVATQLQVNTVDADHYSIMRTPACNEIARLLQAALAATSPHTVDRKTTPQVEVAVAHSPRRIKLRR